MFFWIRKKKSKQLNRREILLRKIFVGLILRSLNLITWSNRLTVLHPLSNFVVQEAGVQASKAKLCHLISTSLQSLHQNLLPGKILYKLLERINTLKFQNQLVIRLPEARVVRQNKRNLWARVAKVTKMNPSARVERVREKKPKLCIRVSK